MSKYTNVDTQKYFQDIVMSPSPVRYCSSSQKWISIYTQDCLKHSAFNHMTHYKFVTRTGENHTTWHLKHHTFLESSTVHTRFQVLRHKVAVLSWDFAYTGKKKHIHGILFFSIHSLYNTRSISCTIQNYAILQQTGGAFTNFRIKSNLCILKLISKLSKL